MFLIRILANLIIFAIEVAAIAAVAWAGWRYPLILAAVAAALALGMGMSLERARLRNEITFYFGRALQSLSAIGSVFALGNALVKAAIAAFITVLTFSGTDAGRLQTIAIVFGVCLFAGTSLLRRLSIVFDTSPTRWGYFRLAGPLGLLYSAALAFLPNPSTAEIGRRLLLDTPARPSLAQASELLFVLKQKFDDIVVGMLGLYLPPDAAKAAGVLISVNMLTGFAISLFAVAIAEMLRRMEIAARV